MNRPLTPQQHAKRLTVALQTTTQRYLAGYMRRSTFRIHMRALLELAHRHGLTALVLQQLGILR